MSSLSRKELVRFDTEVFGRTRPAPAPPLSQPPSCLQGHTLREPTFHCRPRERVFPSGYTPTVLVATMCCSSWSGCHLTGVGATSMAKTLTHLAHSHILSWILPCSLRTLLFFLGYRTYNFAFPTHTLMPSYECLTTLLVNFHSVPPQRLVSASILDIYELFQLPSSIKIRLPSY